MKMKVWAFCILSLLGCMTAFAVESQTVDTDWCTIVSPKSCDPGKYFTVKVTLKGEIPDGMKIAGDLHKMRTGADGTLGYLAWGGAPKAAKSGATYEFKYKMQKLSGDVDACGPIYYLSTKGWNEAIKRATCKPISAGAASASSSGASSASAGPSGATQSADSDWCTIVTPETCAPGKYFTVKVTLKGNIPAGLNLASDLHKMKKGKDGSVAYLSWGGNPKPAKSGATYTFKYKMPEVNTLEDGCGPIFYLSAKGWNEAVKRANSKPVLADGAALADIQKRARPATATLKRSWLKLGSPYIKGKAEGETWKSGETVTIPIEYFVHSEDDWGGTSINFWTVGPWIDNPDGVYTKSRYHQQYGAGVPTVKCEIGKVVKTEVSMKLPSALSGKKPEEGKFGDSILFIGFFKGYDGKNWPTQTRIGTPLFFRADGFFEIDAETPGNLFPYEQPVVMNVIPGTKLPAGSTDEFTYTVTNINGSVVAEGKANFNGKETVPLKLDIKEKGTFLIRVSAPGMEDREVTFARIPNMEKLIGDKPTRFGGQKFPYNLEAIKAARMLGMSSCRIWLNWAGLEPTPGEFDAGAFASVRKQVDALNKHHIRPWLMLNGVPKWAIDNPNVHGGEFTALPFRDPELDRIVTKLAQEFKNDIIGFEWLNEIVSGSACKDPVADYVRFCKVGSAAAKRVNPKFLNQPAGGLWPRTYLQSLIAAGLADHIDILPVHYGTGSTIRGARKDLATVGADKRVAVWDNETAAGYSTWKMPLSVAMKDKKQSDYFFTRFPDELIAGAELIEIFGGEPDPAGNWSHFWADMSPRPSASVLAVLVYGLADAKPIGEFYIGKNGSVKLFERPTRPMIMVVSSIEKGGETVSLMTGVKSGVTMIDQQGNTTALDGNGQVSLKLNESPYFVEGGDPDTLKSNLVVSFPGIEAGMPRYNSTLGTSGSIPLRMTNVLSKPVSVTISMDSATGPGKASVVKSGNLAVGQSVTIPMTFDSPKAGTFNTSVKIEFSGIQLPAITRSIALTVVDPADIGNKIKNPGFEFGEGNSATDWGNSGRHGKRFEFTDPDEPGHGKYVYRFEAGKSYQSIWQGIAGKVVPGDYVYSMWIKTKDFQAGSNFGGTNLDGKAWNWHWLRVFQSPMNQDHWQLFTCLIKAENAKSLTSSPVALGKGWAMLDNVMLVPYEGTTYSSFAPKAGSIKVDGNIDDFNKSCPIPLIGRNQLKIHSSGYDWSPKNLNGVAYFNWDKDNLYVAFEIVDNIHVANKTEANCKLDDCVEVAVHPLNRLPGEDSKAFRYYFSSVAPGGSGKHTIYRPAEFCGGLKSGSLAKDSSVYDISVVRKGNKTVYEVAMPWSELGGLRGVIGSKLGISLGAHDNDGSGPAASMYWGEGLHPFWSPSAFGQITLSE